MPNLTTDKYTVFMIDTDIMTPEQYKDLANANHVIFECPLTDVAANIVKFTDDVDKSFREHELFLEEVKSQNKEIDRRMELGEEKI